MCHQQIYPNLTAKHSWQKLNWKEIVIRDKYITSGEPAALDKPLSSRPECWDFIVDDLKAATDLPESYAPGDVGRATRGAAYA